MDAEVFGIIAPHPPIMVSAVGGRRAEVVCASLEALSRVERAVERYAPETIVVMSPHAPTLVDSIAIDDADHYAGSLAQFGDTSVHERQGDSELARAIAVAMRGRSLPVSIRSEDRRLRSGELDHGVIVPLSFIEPAGDFALVVLSLSYVPYASHRAIGEAVSEAAANLGRRVIFLASGDLSHRLTPDAPAGYSPRAAGLDAAIVDRVKSGQMEQLATIDQDLVEAGGECGLRSFIALSGFVGEDPVPTTVLSYEGPWGVGYLTALVGEAAVRIDRETSTASVGAKGGSASQAESEIVRLARTALELYVREGVRLSDPELQGEEYPERAGAFVSFHKGSDLRGCIGTIAPTRSSLAEEVVANAIEAGTRDPRFPPVSADELDLLDVKVDVLHEPEACSLEHLDPRKFGVITTSGWRRGLLLPDLEGVDDVMTQVEIAMRKAGIGPDDPCSYERFKVDRYT